MHSETKSAISISYAISFAFIFEGLREKIRSIRRSLHIFDIFTTLSISFYQIFLNHIFLILLLFLKKNICYRFSLSCLIFSRHSSITYLVFGKICSTLNAVSNRRFTLCLLKRALIYSHPQTTLDAWILQGNKAYCKFWACLF